MLVVYFVNYGIAKGQAAEWINATGWRWMFGSETIPATLFLLLLFFVRRSEDKAIRVITLLFMLAGFLLSLKLFLDYDPTLSGRDTMQFMDRLSWFPEYGIEYKVGLDGMSLLLFVLTTFLGPLVILCSWSSITQSVKAFHVSMLLLQTAMLGAFVALNLFLFYIFWEAMLIPMYFIIGIWGGQRRIYAAIKFFLYTLAGSLLMLVAILYLYFQYHAQSFGLHQLGRRQSGAVRLGGPVLLEQAFGPIDLSFAERELYQVEENGRQPGVLAVNLGELGLGQRVEGRFSRQHVGVDLTQSRPYPPFGRDIEGEAEVGNRRVGATVEIVLEARGEMSLQGRER